MSGHGCVLIGCGHRGEAHARAITDAGGLELVAVCDRNPEKVEDFADRFAVPNTYTDLDDALNSGRSSHVSVVTAPTGRAETAAAVLEHDPPSIMLEKPVANTLDEVERIADALGESGAFGTVCHQKPYADEVSAVKRWIDEGRLGRIERLVGSTKGGLTGQGTHFLHALNWLVDDAPTAVRGFAEGPVSLDPARNPWVPDHAEPEDTVLELTYPDDVRGFLHLGPNAPDVPARAGTFWYEFRLDVVGTEGRAEFVLGDHAAGVFADGTERVDARDFDEDAYMTRGLYEDVAAVLSGEADAHLADFESALTVHRIVDGAMRSALDGRAVPVAERPPDVGRPTNERLRRHLVSRRPVAASTALFRDRSTAFRALSELGIARVDLWSIPDVANHVDPATDAVEALQGTLADHGLSVSAVSVGGADVEARIDLAAELGASRVIATGSPGAADDADVDTLASWARRAADRDLSLAILPDVTEPRTVEELVDRIEAVGHPAARVALAPPALVHAGVDPEAALARLGDLVDVLYLWDTEPGAARSAVGDWWERPDSQVPGGGTAVDVEGLLEAAIDHAPEAEWVIRYHGTDDWSDGRVRSSVARALRVVENARP